MNRAKMTSGKVIADLTNMFYEVAGSSECREYGATDSEPCAIYCSILRKAIHGVPWEDCVKAVGDWDVYTSIAGWKTCVRKLNSMAKKAHKLAQKYAYLLEDSDLQYMI
jgi:hypothetical protein